MIKRLTFAVLAAVAISAPAFAEDTIASLRQPAIDKCLAAGSGGDNAVTVEMCMCLIDGIIAKIPGEDGVKMLKLVIADPKSAKEAEAALGMSADETKAFVAAHQQSVAEAATACVPQP